MHKITKSIATGAAIAAAVAGAYEIGHKNNTAAVRETRQAVGKSVLDSLTSNQNDLKALTESEQLTPARVKRLSNDTLLSQLGDIQGLVLDITTETGIPSRDIVSTVLRTNSVTALHERGVRFTYDTPANECLNAYSEKLPNGKVEFVIPLANSSTSAPTL